MMEKLEMMVNNEAEKHFLLSHLQPHMRVLEYGSGGSTLAIAPLVKELISIENNQLWYNKLTPLVPGNVKLYYMPEDKGPTAEYDDGTYQDFRKYVDLPVMLAGQDKFDVIFIDGRARVACASVCDKMAHENTLVFIHDYNHPEEKWRRKEYYEAEKYLERMEGVFTMWKFKVKPYVG